MSDMDVEAGEGLREAVGTSGLSRRTLLKAGAAVGGGIWAAPAVESFVSKAAAASVAQVTCQQTAFQSMIAESATTSYVYKGQTGTLYNLTVQQYVPSGSNCYYAENPNTGATSSAVGSWTTVSGIGTIVSSTVQTQNCFSSTSADVATAQLFVPDGQSDLAEYKVAVTFSKTSTAPSITCSNSIQGDPTSPPPSGETFPRNITV